MRTRTPPTAATWPATAEPHAPRREAGRTPTCAVPPRLGQTAGQRPFPGWETVSCSAIRDQIRGQKRPAGGSGGRRGAILTARWGRAACLGRRWLGRRLPSETLVVRRSEPGSAPESAKPRHLVRIVGLPAALPLAEPPPTTVPHDTSDLQPGRPGRPGRTRARLETTQVGPGEQVGRRPGRRYSQGGHHHPRAGARGQAGIEGHPSPCQVSWWSHGWR